MKSDPIGIRFNKDLVKTLKKEGKAKTYQGVHSFLEKFYLQSKHRKNIEIKFA